VPWNERRYANNVTWEFRVKVQIEGVPVHCWATEVAALVIGNDCVIQYLEETTRRRQRTRPFDPVGVVPRPMWHSHESCAHGHRTR
jgi:hypothetical protein